MQNQCGSSRTGAKRKRRGARAQTSFLASADQQRFRPLDDLRAAHQTAYALGSSELVGGECQVIDTHAR